MGDGQRDETQKPTTEPQESFIDINDQRIRVVSQYKNDMPYAMLLGSRGLHSSLTQVIRPPRSNSKRKGTLWAMP